MMLSAKLLTAEPQPIGEPQPLASPTVKSEGVSAVTFHLLVKGPDGAPLPDASVEFRGSPKLTRQQVRKGNFDRKGSYGTFVKTDKDGCVTISQPETRRSLRLSIKKPGYGPYWTDWSKSDHQKKFPARFTARLDKAWRVGGIVVDQDGKPIQGVEVDPSVDYKKRPGDKRHMGVGTSLKTDQNGVWSYDMVPFSTEPERDYVFVSFNHPDYQALRRPLKRERFELKPGDSPTTKIELPVGLMIAGTVTDAAGKPVEGALVKTKFVNEIRKQTTDKKGKYQITGCEERNVRIVVSAKGYATDMLQQQVAADMTPVDFHLKPGGHVRVRVLDQNGKGVNRARIFFQEWRGPFNYFEFSHVNQYTDEDGAWEWNEAPLDEFQADIGYVGAMDLESQPLLAREKEYIFTPPELLVISGKVIDATTKQPVPNFRVLPGTRNQPGRGTDDWWIRDEGFDAKNGVYKIVRREAAPTHMLRIEAPGYKVTRSRDILSTEGKVDVSFELTPAQNISVQLLTPDGKPAAKAEVALAIKEAQINMNKGLITDQSTYATRVVADENGRFGLPARDDDYQLLATHPQGFAIMKPVDNVLPKTVTLTEFAKVEGVFKVGDKVGQRIRLSLEESEVYAWGSHDVRISNKNETTTDNDGHFVFERVIPGRGFLGPEMHSMVGQGHRTAMSSRRTPIQSTAGRTTTLKLGGDGRRVTGKLVAPKNQVGKVLWNFASIFVEVDTPQPDWPTPPTETQNDKAATQKWWTAYQQSDAGKAKLAEIMKQREESRNLPTFWVSVAKDGTFHINDVKPGKYVLSLSFDEQSPGQLEPIKFEVPKLNNEEIGKRLSIGNLQLQKR